MEPPNSLTQWSVRRTSPGTPSYLYDLPRLDADAARLTAAFPDPGCGCTRSRPTACRGSWAGWRAPGSVRPWSRRARWRSPPGGIRPPAHRARRDRQGGRRAPGGRARRRGARPVAVGEPRNPRTRRAPWRAGHPRRAWTGAPSRCWCASTRRSIRRRHDGLAVGAADSKFGVLPDELPAVVDAGGGVDGPLRWRGLHLHVGSQLGAVDAWRSALRVGLRVLSLQRAALADMDTLDIGSGFPVEYGVDGSVPGPEVFADAAGGRGRGVVGGRTPAPARDGARPSRHRGVRLARGARAPCPRTGRVGRPAALGGARCGHDRAHPPGALRRGAPDAGAHVERETGESRPPGCRGSGWTDPSASRPIGWGSPTCRPWCGVTWWPSASAGAYGSSMASTYNGRPRPPELAWDGSRLRALRRRGSVSSLP